MGKKKYTSDELWAALERVTSTMDLWGMLRMPTNNPKEKGKREESFVDVSRDYTSKTEINDEKR